MCGSQIDMSGRLSLKKTTSSDWCLVIHNVLPTDSGTYFCSIIYADRELQHVTVVNVTGI